MSNAKPDYEGYAKSLEIIRDGVTKDYWASLLDINRHQVNVSRTYLWVSAALLGAYAAIFDRFQSVFLGSTLLVVLIAISFLLSASAFGICLYSMPARKGYKSIPSKGWGEFSSKSYQLLKTGSDQVYVTFLQEHISKIDHAWAFNFKTNQSRAKLLRLTSWLLIVSFLVVFFSVVVASTDYVLSNRTGEIMQNENSGSTNEEPTLSIPEPPESADIGSDDISTHSADPSESMTFVTESVQSKD